MHQIVKIISLFLMVGFALSHLSGCSLFGPGDDRVFAMATNYFKEQGLENPDVADPSSLPIQVNYTLSRKPIVDTELVIDFEYVPTQDSSFLGVAFLTTEGLDFENTLNQTIYEPVIKDQIIKYEVEVEPKEEGHFYLDVYVVMDVEGQKRAKKFQVPIAIGEYSKVQPRKILEE